MKLSVKLIAAFIAVVLLATASVLVTAMMASETMVDTSSSTSQAALEEEVGEGAEAQAVELQESIDHSMKDQYKMVRSWAKSPTIINTCELAASYTLEELYDAWSDPTTREWDGDEAMGDGDPTNDINPEASLYLNELQESTKDDGKVVYPEIFFTDARGYAIAATGATGDFDQGPDDWRVFKDGDGNPYYTKHSPAPGGEGWYRDANAAPDGIYISEVVWDDSALTWGIEICVVIENTVTDERVGTLKAVFDYGAFISNMLECDNEDAHGHSETEIKIVNQDGIIVAATGADAAKVNDPTYDMTELTSVSRALAAEDTGNVLENEEDGDDVLTGWAVSEDVNGHIVLVSKDADEVFAPSKELSSDIESQGNSLMMQIAVVGTIGTIVAMFIAFIVAKSTTKPIVHLGNVAKKVKDGELDVSAKVTGPDEIMEFSRAFDDMITSVRMLLETGPMDGIGAIGELEPESNLKM